MNTTNPLFLICSCLNPRSRFLGWGVIALFIYLLTPDFAQAQIVPNGSFENYTQIPDDHNQVPRCVGWRSTNLNTSPDYFHRLSPSSDFTIPRTAGNGLGVQDTPHGDAYIGIGMDTDAAGLPWWEYVSVELDFPIDRSYDYEVELLVNKADGSTWDAMRSLSMLFTESSLVSSVYSTTPLNTIAASVLPPNGDAFIVTNTSVLSDETNWVTFSGTIPADPGQADLRHLAIGNFLSIPDYRLDLSPTVPAPLRAKSYYFIEKVSVRMTTQNIPCDCNDVDYNLERNDNGSWTLTVSAPPSCDDDYAKVRLRTEASVLPGSGDEPVVKVGNENRVTWLLSEGLGAYLFETDGLTAGDAIVELLDANGNVVCSKNLNERICGCSDYSVSVVTPSSPEQTCCWDIRVDIGPDACNLLFLQVTHDGNTESILGYTTDGSTRVYRYCSQSTDIGQPHTLDIDLMRSSNAEPICSLQEQVNCEVCDCENGYTVKYVPLGQDPHPNTPDWCCYRPVIYKTSANACDIFGAHVDATGHLGYYQQTPIMPNVGDSLVLPDFCIHKDSTIMGVKFYRLLEDPGNGDDPMCGIEGPLDGCCNCEETYSITVQSTSTDPDCCYRVDIQKIDPEGCEAKGIAVYDEQGNYTQFYHGSATEITADYFTMCFDKVDVPTTWEFRFFADFPIDPNNPPSAMCSLFWEVPDCEENCCNNYKYTVITENRSDFMGIKKCAVLVIDELVPSPDCLPFGVMIIDPETQQVVTNTYNAGNPSPMAFPFQIDLCCRYTWEQGYSETWEVYLLDEFGNPILDFLDHPCLKSIDFSCGTIPSTKEDLSETIESDLSKQLFNVSLAPNPSQGNTNLHLQLGTDQTLEIKVVDVAGKVVWQQAKRSYPAGTHQQPLLLEGLSPGIYFIQLDSPEQHRSLKFMIRE